MDSVPAQTSKSTQDQTQRLQQVLRQTMRPVQVRDLHLGDSATFHAQFWIDRLPLRITAGWSLVAALLAAGLFWKPQMLTWPSLVLLWLLVDPLWGGIWRLAAGRTENLSLEGRVRTSRFWLPYLQPGSPAAQLAGAGGPASLPLLYRIALPSVIIGLLVASALNTTALALTGIVVLLGLIGWITVRVQHRSPVLLHACVTVALPWLLAIDIAGINSQHEAWTLQFALLILWTLFFWGAERVLLHQQDWLAVGIMAVSALGIGVLLLVAQAPFWLALLVILWLPTWLGIYQRRSLARQQFWWLAAMLISALAMGQLS